MSLRECVRNIEEVLVDGVKKYKYQDSPTFDNKAQLIIWLRKNIGEL